MNAAGRIGLLGGTLDPIHLGHVETAKAARAALGLERVIILPSRVPPHRALQPIASRYHRFAMSALAVNGVEGLAVSDLELCAPGPSYTADTLTRFHESSGLAASQVFFITGADAFAEIATWHRYPEVLGLANFVVVSRPGFPAEAMRERLRELGGTMITVQGSGFRVRGSLGFRVRGSGFGVRDSRVRAGSGFAAFARVRIEFRGARSLSLEQSGRRDAPAPTCRVDCAGLVLRQRQPGDHALSVPRRDGQSHAA
jgi:nicotinate (nicotinamide) nucleotide adenylyltransferase